MPLASQLLPREVVLLSGASHRVFRLIRCETDEKKTLTKIEALTNISHSKAVLKHAIPALVRAPHHTAHRLRAPGALPPARCPSAATHHATGATSAQP